jgi:predicted dehydrogenase
MIRAGCIGTGGICAVHLSYLKSRDDVEIAALCDINETNLSRRQKEFGGKAYTDFREMLAAEKLDAVWLCTPPQVRREPLIACAERGLPVLCEKPVERDPDAAFAIAEELQKLNARVQIGYVFRSIPIVARLRKAMADDKAHLVQSLYGCGVSLSRSLPAWFYRKELSGGALVDQATHNLDLLRSLLGEVVSVRGVAANPVEAKKEGYTVDEVLALSFVFENGTVGGHVHTWVGDRWRNEMTLVGQKRTYRLNLGSSVLTVEEGPETTTFADNQGSMYEHQNRVFLEMVKSGDWSANPCDYADGAKTLRLTTDCDLAMG